MSLAEVTATHHDLMERLAWCWDALGMVERDAGRHDTAVRFFEAAWKLGGWGRQALHLAEGFERLPNRRADAASWYLVARSQISPASASLEKKLVEYGLPPELSNIRRGAEAMHYAHRAVELPEGVPPDAAEILLTADQHGVVTAVHVLKGSEATRAGSHRLVGAKLPLASPEAKTSRLVVKLVIYCNESGRCGAAFTPSRVSSGGK